MVSMLNLHFSVNLTSWQILKLTLFTEFEKMTDTKNKIKLLGFRDDDHLPKPLLPMFYLKF